MPIIIVIVTAVILALVVIVALVEWRTAFLEMAILAKYSGSRKKQVIGLSFDDGPDWGEEQLIAALNCRKMRASFFWILEKVINLQCQNPTRFMHLVDLLKAGGHEIGMHGLSCSIPPMWRRIWGVTDYNEIVRMPQDFSTLLGGYKPILYRPHGFQLGRDLYRGIKDSGIIFVAGSLQLAIGPREKDLGRKYLINFLRVRPGDIVCGHDSCDCDTDFGIASEIAKVTIGLVVILNGSGLQAETLYQVIH